MKSKIILLGETIFRSLKAKNFQHFPATNRNAAEFWITLWDYIFSYIKHHIFTTYENSFLFRELAWYIHNIMFAFLATEKLALSVVLHNFPYTCDGYVLVWMDTFKLHDRLCVCFLTPTQWHELSHGKLANIFYIFLSSCRRFSSCATVRHLHCFRFSFQLKTPRKSFLNEYYKLST